MVQMRDAVVRHNIARKLPLAFDVAALEADLRHIDERWWGVHLGPYHNGAWDVVALWAPGGDMRNQRSSGGAFAPTQALDLCPYFAQVMDAFPCDKHRVRLMRLRPGGHILRHTDPAHEISPKFTRIHVPITTHPAVHFWVREQRVLMQPGEAWHVEVRFPHEVHNQGAHPRVHLVLDLLRNAALEALLAQATSAGTGYLTTYVLKHALPGPLKRRLGIGN